MPKHPLGSTGAIYHLREKRLNLNLTLFKGHTLVAFETFN